jgi:hypothetical protein
MSVKYPKISGNISTGSHPTGAEFVHEDGFSKFDLLNKEISYDGIDISSGLPSSIFTHVVTHGVDGHTEAYAFIIIKNAEPEGSAPTNLTLQKISIHQGNSPQGATLGTEIWGTDGTDANFVHQTSGPIECDYKVKDGSGNDVLTPDNDANRGKPFVGIQNESDGSTGSGGTANLVETNNDAAVDNITDSNFFVKFKVTSLDGTIQLQLVDPTSTDHHIRIPLYDVHKLCQDINGGIPNNSYAAFMIRVNIDDVAAFDTDNFTLVINHDGITSDQNSQDIHIPIQLSSENLMLCEVRIGNSLLVTNDGNAVHSTSLRDIVNTHPIIDPTPSADVFYDLVGTGLSVSQSTRFATQQDADDYIANNGQVDTFNATKTAFSAAANVISWTEASAVKETKDLTVSFSDDGTLLSSENLVENKSGTFTLDETQNNYTVSLEQTAVGASTSTLSTLPFGGYANFDFANDATQFVATFFAQGERDDETKTSIITVPYIKYPLFSIPAVTSDKTCSADFPPTGGIVNGVNNSWSVSLIDTEPILHTSATSVSDNYTFPVLQNHLLSTVQHFVPGGSDLYGTTHGSVTEFSTLKNARSAVDINVRINSHSPKTDVLYNGITNHTIGTDVKRGFGFTKSGFSVEQCTFASSPESTSALSSFGNGSSGNGDGADDIVPAGISTLENPFRDYSVKLVTTNARIDIESEDYDYATRQIQGLGAERYTGQLSLPTGIIDYGSGKVPNHVADNEIINFCFTQYPSLPDLKLRVFNGFTAGATSVSADNETSPTQVSRWQKLTVLPNTLTGAVSSTRGSATDGLYDWAKDAASSNANKGTFKMPSTNNATVTNASPNVDIKSWEICDVAEATADGAGILKISTGQVGNIQAGMRLICQATGTGATANSTEFLSKKIIISELNAGTGALTLREDLGYAADGTSLTADPDLPVIPLNANVMFVDDWIQPNMMVEHDNLEDTNKGYYISAMTYVGGDNDGQAYSLDTLNAARTAGTGATAVRLALKHKDDNTNASPIGSESGEKITIFKPYQDFSQVEAGINLFYEIKNQSLHRTKVGEKVRIKTGLAIVETFTAISGSASENEETTITASPSLLAPDSAICDIIVDNPKEFGVTKTDGTLLGSKKNVGSPGQGGAYADYVSNKLGIYEFDVTNIESTGAGVSFYVQRFTVKFGNGGCEDLYLHSAEFIDALWTKHQQAGGRVVEMQPGDAINVNWQVSKTNAASYSLGTINLGNNIPASEDFSPSALLLANNDKRVTKGVGINDVNQHNSIACQFSVNVGGSITGSYFKYLKVGYVRDTGRTKHYQSNNSIVERVFKDKEVFYAYIPIVCHIDATASIRLSDVDGSTIQNNQAISIDGLIA